MNVIVFINGFLCTATARNRGILVLSSFFYLNSSCTNELYNYYITGSLKWRYTEFRQILWRFKCTSMTLARTSEGTTALLPAALTDRYKCKGIGKMGTLYLTCLQCLFIELRYHIVAISSNSNCFAITVRLAKLILNI